MQPDQLEPSLTDLILRPKSNKIARPPNAFMLFARDHRRSLAKKYPTHSNKNISSLLGQCWKKVDSSTRTEYFKKAKMLEELHKQKYPGYVYSPRIARLQKMARKKQKSDKCEGGEVPRDEVPAEPVEQNNMRVHTSEKCNEWNDVKLEKKQSSPGYIPNNPQYFPDPEPGPRPELTCPAESNITPAVVSKVPACSCCQPSTWNASSAESTGVTCAGSCPDECGARSKIYEENYYPKMGQLEIYDYGGPWNQYPDYAYEASASSAWGTCSTGCQGACCAIHPNDEHSSYAHLSSPHHPDTKNTYYHYNSPAAYGNPSYPYAYGPYNDSPMPYVPRRYAPYNQRPKAHASYFSRSMDWYHQQYQHFQNYYPKYPHAAQPTDCPPILESKCPSGYHTEIIYDSRPVHVEEMTDSYNTAQGPDGQHENTTGQSGYPTEVVYEYRTAQVEEMTDSGSTEQTADSQSKNEEQVHTESDGNEMVNVVDIEYDVVAEEVVESTSPGLEHGVQDV